MAKFVESPSGPRVGQSVGPGYEIVRTHQFSSESRSYQVQRFGHRLRIKELFHRGQGPKFEFLCRLESIIEGGTARELLGYRHSFSSEEHSSRSFVFEEREGISLPALLQNRDLSPFPVSHLLKELCRLFSALEQAGILEFIGEIDPRSLIVDRSGVLHLADLPIDGVLPSETRAVTKLQSLLESLVGIPKLADHSQLRWLLARCKTSNYDGTIQQLVRLFQEEEEFELIVERKCTELEDQYYGFTTNRRTVKRNPWTWLLSVALISVCFSLLSWDSSQSDFQRQSSGVLLARGSDLFWQGQEDGLRELLCSAQTVSDLAFDSSRQLVYVSDSTAPGIKILSSERLVELDEIKLWSPVDCMKLQSEEGLLFALASQQRHIAVVDVTKPSARVVGAINVGDGPHHFDCQGSDLVVASESDGWIGLFQTRPNVLLSSRRIASAGAVAWNPTRSEIYLALPDRAQILVLSPQDLRTMEVMDGIVATELRVSSEGDRLLLSDQERLVQEIDLDKRTVGRALELPTDLFELHLGNREEKIRATTLSPPRLMEIDPVSFKVTSRELGLVPDAVKGLDMSLKEPTLAP